jgi:hypothetical protein
VNRVANDDPRLIEPVPPAKPGQPEAAPTPAASAKPKKRDDQPTLF